MIKIKNLNLSFGDLIIFQNAQINIPKNKITILIGANGKGKTTLLKAILGIIKSQNIDIEKNYKNVFYLPQKIKYPSKITLLEYIESYFYGKNWKWFLSKDEKLEICHILELLELKNKENILIENLSSGELQKANIALGLLMKADMMLLDEPTSNMDLVNQLKVLDMIKELSKKGITCLMVLHDINLAQKYGDYFIGISKNSKIIQKEKDEFFTPEILKEIYNIDFKVIKNNENTYIQIIN